MRRLLRPQSPYTPSYRALVEGTTEVPRGLGPAPIAPSQPEALQAERGLTVRLPGVNFPPAGSIPVDEIGDANVAPGGTATLVTIRIPDTLRFRMVGIGFGANDEVALQFVTWNIRANGDTVPGYPQVAAAVGSIRQLADIFVLVGSSATVTIVVTVGATAVLTYRYICRVRGHFYQEQEG